MNAQEREEFKRSLNADKLEYRKSIFKLQENLQTKLEQMIAWEYTHLNTYSLEKLNSRFRKQIEDLQRDLQEKKKEKFSK